jgi:hypothetical protein
MLYPAVQLEQVWLKAHSGCSIAQPSHAHGGCWADEAKTNKVIFVCKLAVNIKHSLLEAITAFIIMLVTPSYTFSIDDLVLGLGCEQFRRSTLRCTLVRQAGLCSCANAPAPNSALLLHKRQRPHRLRLLSGTRTCTRCACLQPWAAQHSLLLLGSR